MGCQASKAVSTYKNEVTEVQEPKEKTLPVEERASDGAALPVVDPSRTRSELTMSTQEDDRDVSAAKAKNGGEIEKDAKDPNDLPAVKPEMSIEEQIQQLPDAESAEQRDGKVSEPVAVTEDKNDETEDWHHSIKVDQLALKLQYLSSEWAETKDQVHYKE